VRKRLVLTLFAGVVLMSTLAACGDGDDNDTATTTESTPAATSAAATAPASTPAAAATREPTPTAPQVLNVRAGEYFFDPKDFQVRPGAITVTMTNEGPERPHTFVVKNRNGEGDLAKTDRVPVGSAPVTLEFTIMEEGTYEVYCSLPGHADRGQRGTLTVARS
jgi:plastocyanin